MINRTKRITRLAENILSAPGFAFCSPSVDAMEGMTVDSPIGPMTMRKEDHLIQMPMFYGKTGKDASGKVVATDINTLPADQVMPNVDDVLKLRSK